MQKVALIVFGQFRTATLILDWRTFPKWKSIKWDYNALDSPSHKEALYHIFHIEGRETYRDF